MQLIACSQPEDPAPANELEREVAAAYNAYASELLHCAESLSGSQDRARDAVQEVFLRYFIQRRYGSRIENPRAWLYRVLRNHLLDCRNSLASRSEVASEIDSLPSPARNPEQALQLSDLARSIAEALTAREWDCFRLRVAGFSYVEIAGALGLRSGTVGALLSRAQRRLLPLATR